MGKGLGVFGRMAGVLLLSASAASVLSACGKSSPLPPRLKTGTESDGVIVKKDSPEGKTQAPIDCNPSVDKLSKAVGATIEQRFGAVVSAFETLSVNERDELFVDRDIKGNKIQYRGEGGPDEPTVAPWAHKDLAKDGIPGTGTERAYAELNLKSDGEPIVVAVIDSAIDIEHEALKDNVWTNPKADPAYPGAVHGWNFLGGKDGKSVYHTTLELTRELRRMRILKGTSTLPASQQAYLDKLEAAYEKGKGEAATKLALRTKSRDQLSAALEVLRTHCLIKEGTLAEVKAIQSDNPAIVAARDAALVSLKQGRDLKWYKSSIAHWTAAVKLNEQYYYNLDFDSSSVVGDDPTKMDEVYGNSDVMPEDADEIHATHVAGIIGAVRGKHPGLNGQAQNVRIMALRAVPDGDERDKDVANAIRFAVDHGARIINMSFGKYYSPNRDYVWQMIKYANEKGVLIVHAAGNDSMNTDTGSHYPDREVRDGDRNLVETLPNVIEVGASSVNKDKDLPAEFSNYGHRAVDLFAPGAQIYSTVPGNHYAELDGTSMASPEVAGVAALVLSQYPNLSVAELKERILGGVNSFKGLTVIQPNADPSADPSLVDFAVLSVTGGVVNAYETLRGLAH